MSFDAAYPLKFFSKSNLMDYYPNIPYYEEPSVSTKPHNTNQNIKIRNITPDKQYTDNGFNAIESNNNNMMIIREDKKPEIKRITINNENSGNLGNNTMINQDYVDLHIINQAKGNIQPLNQNTQINENIQEMIRIPENNKILEAKATLPLNSSNALNKYPTQNQQGLSSGIQDNPIPKKISMIENLSSIGNTQFNNSEDTTKINNKTYNFTGANTTRNIRLYPIPTIATTTTTTEIIQPKMFLKSKTQMNIKENSNNQQMNFESNTLEDTFRIIDELIKRSKEITTSTASLQPISLFDIQELVIKKNKENIDNDLAIVNENIVNQEAKPPLMVPTTQINDPKPAPDKVENVEIKKIDKINEKPNEFSVKNITNASQSEEENELSLVQDLIDHSSNIASSERGRIEMINIPSQRKKGASAAGVAKRRAKNTASIDLANTQEGILSQQQQPRSEIQQDQENTPQSQKAEALEQKQNTRSKKPMKVLERSYTQKTPTHEVEQINLQKMPTVALDSTNIQRDILPERRKTEVKSKPEKAQHDASPDQKKNKISKEQAKPLERSTTQKITIHEQDQKELHKMPTMAVDTLSEPQRVKPKREAEHPIETPKPQKDESPKPKKTKAIKESTKPLERANTQKTTVHEPEMKEFNKMATVALDSSDIQKDVLPERQKNQGKREVEYIVETPKPQRDEPAKPRRDEPAKAQRTETTKAQKDEPAKAQKDELTKAQRNEPTKAQRDEPAKAQRDEPLKSQRDEVAKAQRDESPIAKKTKAIKEPSNALERANTQKIRVHEPEKKELNKMPTVALDTLTEQHTNKEPEHLIALPKSLKDEPLEQKKPQASKEPAKSLERANTEKVKTGEPEIKDYNRLITVALDSPNLRKGMLSTKQEKAKVNDKPANTTNLPKLQEQRLDKQIKAEASKEPVHTKDLSKLQEQDKPLDQRKNSENEDILISASRSEQNLEENDLVSNDQHDDILDEDDQPYEDQEAQVEAPLETEEKFIGEDNPSHQEIQDQPNIESIDDKAQARTISEIRPHNDDELEELEGEEAANSANQVSSENIEDDLKIKEESPKTLTDLDDADEANQDNQEKLASGEDLETQEKLEKTQTIEAIEETQGESQEDNVQSTQKIEPISTEFKDLEQLTNSNAYAVNTDEIEEVQQPKQEVKVEIKEAPIPVEVVVVEQEQEQEGKARESKHEDEDIQHPLTEQEILEVKNPNEVSKSIDPDKIETLKSVDIASPEMNPEVLTESNLENNKKIMIPTQESDSEALRESELNPQYDETTLTKSSTLDDDKNNMKKEIKSIPKLNHTKEEPAYTKEEPTSTKEKPVAEVKVQPSQKLKIQVSATDQDLKEPLIMKTISQDSNASLSKDTSQMKKRKADTTKTPVAVQSTSKLAAQKQASVASTSKTVKTSAQNDPQASTKQPASTFSTKLPTQKQASTDNPKKTVSQKQPSLTDKSFESKTPQKTPEMKPATRSIATSKTLPSKALLPPEKSSRSSLAKTNTATSLAGIPHETEDISSFLEEERKSQDLDSKDLYKTPAKVGSLTSTNKKSISTASQSGIKQSTGKVSDKGLNESLPSTTKPTTEAVPKRKLASGITPTSLNNPTPTNSQKLVKEIVSAANVSQKTSESTKQPKIEVKLVNPTVSTVKVMTGNATTATTATTASGNVTKKK